MEHGLEYIVFYLQKHIAPLVVYTNPTVVHDKPSGAPVFVKIVYCGDVSWVDVDSDGPLFLNVLSRSQQWSVPHMDQPSFHHLSTQTGEGTCIYLIYGEAYDTGRHYRDYFPGALSLNEVTSTYWNIRYLGDVSKTLMSS